MYFVRIRAYKVALFMSEMIYWLKEKQICFTILYFIILGMISYMLDLFLIFLNFYLTLGSLHFHHQFDFSQRMRKGLWLIRQRALIFLHSSKLMQIFYLQCSNKPIVSTNICLMNLSIVSTNQFIELTFLLLVCYKKSQQVPFSQFSLTYSNDMGQTVER